MTLKEIKAINSIKVFDAMKEKTGKMNVYHYSSEANLRVEFFYL